MKPFITDNKKLYSICMHMINFLIFSSCFSFTLVKSPFKIGHGDLIMLVISGIASIVIGESQV